MHTQAWVLSVPLFLYIFDHLPLQQSDSIGGSTPLKGGRNSVGSGLCGGRSGRLEADVVDAGRLEGDVFDVRLTLDP